MPLEWNLGFGFDLGNLASGIMNYYSQKETNKANRELAELSYQQNIEQWNRENAYNHPGAQMQRLQEAGLNPNLVYGSGSSVQTSASSPQLSYPRMESPRLDIGSQGFNMERNPLVASQKQVNDSITEYNSAKTIESIAHSDYLNSQTKKNMIDLVTLGARNEALLNKINSEIDANRSLIDLRSSQIEVNKSVRDLNVEQKNKVLVEIQKLGCDIKQAEKLYEHWYSKGLTPSSGFEQLFSQATVLGIDGLRNYDELNSKRKELVPDRYQGDEENEAVNDVRFNPFSREWWEQYMINLDRRPDQGYSMGDWR